MKHLKKALALSSLIVLAACAQKQVAATHSTETGRFPAQDNTRTDLTHASADGRYVGFFEEASLDGSGANLTSFRILDMKTDKYLFDKTLISDEGDENPDNFSAAEQRADLLTLAQKKISQTGLKTTRIKPVQNYSTLDQEGGDWMNERLTFKGTWVMGRKTYSFDVSQVKATKEQMNKGLQWCIGSGYEPALFTLTVNGKVAHQDKKVPGSRSCAFEYGVDKVFDVNGRPLVFIRYKTIGFEGPDYRTITVPMWQ